MVHSSRGFRHHVHAPYPRQGSEPRESSGRPHWAPSEGSGSCVMQFKGAPWWDQFWKEGMAIFRPTGAVEWGFSNDGSSEDKAKVLHVPQTQIHGKTDNS